MFTLEMRCSIHCSWTREEWISPHLPVLDWSLTTKPTSGLCIVQKAHHMFKKKKKKKKSILCNFKAQGSLHVSQLNQIWYSIKFSVFLQICICLNYRKFRATF